MKKSKIFSAGLIRENPNLAQFLGMCPTLAITTSLDNAIGMGMAVIVVLILSNISISIIRKTVPNEIRIPVYIIIIASIVTVIQLLMQAYMQSLYGSLGIFIPLIVVNCIILGRAEAFAAKNGVFDSILDALGMSFGFTLSLILISTIRQVSGTGILSLSNPLDPDMIFFSLNLVDKNYIISILAQPTGAFLTLGLLVAIINAIGMGLRKRTVKKVEAK